jgi:arginine metabolism regulation protein II
MSTAEVVMKSAVPLSRSVFHLPADVEHLLHHYIHHVVDLMTVLPTPEGPWKSFHLPRALQSSAELAFVGKTSNAGNALFHALLTISAYNLAANHGITGQELQAQKWREVALRLRARSLTYLRGGLQPDCPPSERGKYKEVLATMLSMVTIDVG